MPNSLELNVSPALLHTFANHPFHVRKDMEMNELVDSIRESGVIVPLIVRSRPEGGYEIISGHRRCEACRELGIEKVPVRVQELTDDEATILMVNSNIQREHVLPSEKAFAYRMKLEAVKRSAGRPSKNSCQVGTNFRADKNVAEAPYLFLTAHSGKMSIISPGKQPKSSVFSGFPHSLQWFDPQKLPRYFQA